MPDTYHTPFDGGIYQTVAASTTATLKSSGGTGAKGDCLIEILVVPASTSPGAITITDGGGSAITVFAGGAGSLLSLIPFSIFLGIFSINGAWSITTGAGVSAVVTGQFS